MKPLLRMTRTMFESVKEDLLRVHPFAYERVGFLYSKTSESNLISYVFAYESVEDDDYEKDPLVGASISSDAIRKSMQYALDHNCGVFHVHFHGFYGKPSFSGVDKNSLRHLVPSFNVVSPDNIHGGIVLSNDSASSMVLTPGSKRLKIGKISIVGFPTIVRR